MNIHDYLKYYLGCMVKTQEGTGPLILIGDHERGEDCVVSIQNDDEESGFYGEWTDFTFQHERMLPILRRLEDITEEEMIAGGWNSKRALQYYLYHNIGAFHPSDFHYLLSKGFDLFGLIDAGLAIDAKNIKPHHQ